MSEKAEDSPDEGQHIAVLESARRKILSSGLFDAEHYRRLAGLAANDAIEPLDHYLTQGWLDSHAPSADFDGQAYLAANPDVREAGINPLLHWIDYGRAEGRSLGVQPAPEDDANAAPNPGMEAEGRRMRLLAIDATTPMPDSDAGSVIVAAMLRAFLQLDLEVSFFADYESSFDPVYTTALQQDGVRCLTAPRYTTLDSVLAVNGFDVVLVFRHEVARRSLPAIRRHLPTARVIFHSVDLHYLRQQREAELKRSAAGSIAAARAQTLELEMFARADCSIVVTNVEKRIVEAQLPVTNIVEFPYICPVRRSAVPFASRNDIVFLGGYRHAPNVDAITVFCRDAWPSIAEQLPDAKLLVVGSFPTDAVKALSGDRIEVTGMVPDLEPWFARSRVFVAPLRYGAGIKGKLIHSLAHGVPAVATSIATEGMALLDGRHVIIADEAAAMAGAVVDLYRNAALWSALQEAGYAFVEANYSWERCLDMCRLCLETADATWHKREAVRRKLRLQATLDEEGHA